VRPRINSGVLFLALTCVACNGDAAPTTPTSPPTGPLPPPFVRVSGRVIDYRTNATLPGVSLDWRTVSASSPAPGETRSVVADAAGNYALELPPAVTYAVSVLGGVQGGGMVIVPTKTYRTDFFVNPGNCVVMYGFIFDAATQTPVSDAEVSWLGRGTRSGSDGGYRLDAGCGQTYGIGTTSIRVTHPGYAAAFGLGGRAEFLSAGAIARRDHALMPLAPSTPKTTDRSGQAAIAGVLPNVWYQTP
jgi:hypothetical protein